MTTRIYTKIAPRIRFWAKVDQSGECWPWTGHISAQGYGVFAMDAGVTRFAHRFAYEDLVGPIPEGLTLDHVCHNASDCMEGRACTHRRCVNPDHLEPVTRSENTLRGRQRVTHCKNGHEYTPENTRLGPGYGRKCRACARVAGLRAYWRKREGSAT